MKKHHANLAYLYCRWLRKYRRLVRRFVQTDSSLNPALWKRLHRKLDILKRRLTSKRATLAGLSFALMTSTAFKSTDGDLLVEGYVENHSNIRMVNDTSVLLSSPRPLARTSCEAVIDPYALDGTDGFVINALQAGDQLGRSVSNAGDINGDGIDDVIIGAWFADPNGKDFSGEAYVVFGQDGAFSPAFDLSTLNGSNGFAIEGKFAHDRLGVSVHAAGDFNGDGFDDVIIGAYGADHALTYSGEAYVIFGDDGGFPATFDPATLDGTNGVTIPAADDFSHAATGRAVGAAGDVNGDGIDDILIGADGNDKAYVVFGSTSPFSAIIDISALDGSNGFSLVGTRGGTFPNFGRALSKAGDLNADGIDDIIVGANDNDANGISNAGQAFVIFGKDTGFPASIDISGLNGTNGFVISGKGDSDRLGGSVSQAGDVNGDGYDDVILSCLFEDEAYVIYGTNAGFPASFDLTTLDGTNGFTLLSPILPFLGVSSLNDFNNDGVDDIVYGPYVVYGSTSGFGASLDLSTLNGTNGFTFAGRTPSNAGDLNNDGIPDLISSDDIAGAGGEVYVLFGDVVEPDTAPPTITCPGDQNLSCGSTVPNYIPSLAVDDNCSGTVTITQSPGEGSTFVEGMTINMTAEDESGNSSTCSFVIDVENDVTPPVITCPADQALICETATIPNYFSLFSVMDNCNADVTITQSPGEGSTFVEGMTITMTAEDQSGNMSSCTFAINGSADTEVPAITCISNQEVSCGAALPDYTGTITATDNCDSNLTLTQSPAPGSTVSNGMLVTITAEDASGNRDNCSFTVNVTDDGPPTISCIGDQTLSCDDTLPDYTSMITVADDCDSSPPLITQSPAPGSAVTDGMTVVITAEDASANTNSCSFILVFTDNEAPVLSCSGDQTLSCGNVIPDYTTLVTASNNCDSSPTITQAPAPGSSYTDGMTITMTATDEAGNSSQCTFVVYRSSDTSAPDLNCPADQTLTCGAALPDYTNMASASDNCDSNPTVTQSPIAGSTFTPGMLVTLSTTDAAGNTSNCSFTIDLAEDTTAPVITCPGDQPLDVNQNCTLILPDYTGQVTATDDCGNTPEITQSPAPGSVLNGASTVTLTATDASGNTSSCSFSVEPGGDTQPSVNAGEDVQLIKGDRYQLNAVASSNGSFEWSPTTGMLQTNVPNPTVVADETITYTVTFTTDNGCTATDDITIIVENILFKKGFSPDNDGINDTWIIEGVERYLNNEVSIFNRWGDMVFHVTDYNNATNVFAGTANRLTNFGAGNLPEGTYFYVIKLSAEDQPLKGYLVLKK